MSAPISEVPIAASDPGEAVPRLLRGARLGRLGLPAPTVLFVLFALGGPLVYLLFYSFGFFSVDGSPPGTAAWTTFFTTGYYTSAVRQAVEVAAITTAACLVIAYPVAVALASVKNKGLRNVVLVALFVPLFTSVVVRAYGWQVLLGSDGILEWILKPFGVHDPNVLYHLSGVIIALVHIELPFMVYPLMNSIRQIDPSLLQSARDLQAGAVRRFATVIFPLSLPGVISGIQLVFALSIGAFATANLLGGGRVNILPTAIYEDVTNVRWANAAVGCLVLVAIALIALGIFSALGHLVRYQTIEGQLGMAAPGTGPRPGRVLSVVRAVFLGIVVIFMLAPLVLTIINSFSSVAYGTWPPPDLSLKWYRNLAHQDGLSSAIVTSLILGLVATAISLVVGTTGALAVTASRGASAGTAGRASGRVLDIVSMAPNVVPKVALGFAAYIFFNITRVLPGMIGVYAAHVLITLPFVYIVMRGAVERADRSLEAAAQDLGLSRVRAFFSATIPQLIPGLAAAALFAFIISFDEIDMTIFMLPPGKQTVPVWMFTYMQQHQDPTLSALSTILIAFTVLITVTGVLASTRMRRGGALPQLA